MYFCTIVEHQLGQAAADRRGKFIWPYRNSFPRRYELDGADGHREGLAAGEHQRIVECVPTEDEAQDHGDRDARHAAGRITLTLTELRTRR